MNKPVSLSARDTAGHVSSLVELLHETEQGLLKLTGGEVDAILHPSGHTYLLRRTQEQLHQSETLLRIAGRTARLGGWTVDFPEVRLTWSDEVCDIYEVPHSAPVTVDEAINYYAPECRYAIRSAFQKCASEGTPFDLELELITAKNNRIWVRAIGEAVRDASGTIIRVQGALQDISESKRAQEKLAESEGHTRKIFDSMFGFVALFSPEGLVLEMNRAPLEAAGLVREQVVGHPFAETYLWTHSPGAQEQIRAALHRAAQGETVREDFVLRMAEGLNVVIDATFGPITNAGGRVTELVGFGVDITPRKRAEQARQESELRFRQVVENIREVFWMTDVDTEQMLYLSPGYEGIWGRTCESAYIQPAEWLKAIHPEDRERVREATEQKQEAGTYDEEYRIVRPDEAVRWIRDRAFPVKDSSGRVYRIAGVAEDITRQKGLEAQFRQSQKLESVGTLAGGVAHDFNNILGAIMGNTELASLDIGSDHPAKKRLNEIRKACTRARDLVQQILAFSRQQNLERQVLSLAPIIEEVVKLLRASLPANVELAFTAADGCPNVLANPTQIHQILLNLCTNAWHALSGKAGRIEISLHRLEVGIGSASEGLPPGSYASLTVTDNGKGMDKATLDRIFDPFFTTKGPGEGTGLGLAVVHGIVKSHDATITVSSRPALGTTFYLYFPAADAPPETTSPEPGTPKQPSSRGLRVLYLDDEEALVYVGTQIMEQIGCRVRGFSNASEALDAFKANPEYFDVAITDFNMPTMSGLDVTRELLAIRPELPVLLTSGYISDDLKTQATLAGVSQLISKPTTMDELRKAIARVPRVDLSI